ncbi:DUF3347 domain-containing protein [Gracilimonas mengyeensis]|uniref:DUF3347 domain-containing protein n=1 Tax=Gracilimonas mengyeensis TaxID=1302730 RepID=A0A521CXE1_9BACT|nr:DUF3347 domain-containing protein [Gracilimonas mengyeensis]SMO64088.1 Protein of unknown function [Gracilimonas mengyeensis]
MKTILTLTLLSLISFSATAQHEHQGDHQNHQQAEMQEAHRHTQHLDTLIHHYMDAKNALVQDDFESAKASMQAFADEVHSSSEMNQHEEHAEKHEKHHSNMVVAVEEASAAENIEELRAAFQKVSKELITAVENQGYDGTLYKQYCPMYEGGSNWLSKKEEVENPFYGQAMHSCGDAVEEISQP